MKTKLLKHLTLEKHKAYIHFCIFSLHFIFIICKHFVLTCYNKVKWSFVQSQFRLAYSKNIKWDKVFKNEPSKICGRQPLKNVTWSILEYFVPNVNLYSVVSSSM